MDKIYVEIKIKMLIRSEPGVDIEEVINEMDYIFVSKTEDADIENTEIEDYEVIDCK